MAYSAHWWRKRRAKHRDAVILCAVAAGLLLAGELTTPVLRQIYTEHLQPYAADLPVFAIRSALAILAFTTAFGAVLVLAGGWFFIVGRVARGRFLVGMGVGFTSLTLASKIAYSSLVFGTPLTFLLPLATTLTGLGLLVGAGAHIAMGQYALLLKRHARAAWRRWRRNHRMDRRRIARA